MFVSKLYTFNFKIILMNKFFIALIIVLVSVNINAQKKAKLKGNKIVTDVYNTLEGFNSVEIGDNLKVTISQTGSNGYHLLADENLVQDINFVIIDSILKISTTSNITSSKKLEIDLTVRSLQKITLRDDAKLYSSGRISSSSLTLAAFDDSYFKLDLNANNSYFRVVKNAKGELSLAGDKSVMIFDENAFLKGDIRVSDLELKMNNRSDVNVSGQVDTIHVVGADSSTLKGSDLKTMNADVNVTGSSNISINADKNLRIFAKDRGTIYVYGNPDIKVDALQDKSQIVKR